MNPEFLSEFAGMKVIILQKNKAELLQALPKKQQKILFKTTSCQLWYKKECGRCYRCAERHAAFLIIMGQDKTTYSHNPQLAEKWNHYKREFQECM